MVAVATGGPRIDAVNSEYQERRGRIREALQERRIDDLNGFSDLWRWYAYWGQHLPTYQSRRIYIRNMYSPSRRRSNPVRRAGRAEVLMSQLAACLWTANSVPPRIG